MVSSPGRKKVSFSSWRRRQDDVLHRAWHYGTVDRAVRRNWTCLIFSNHPQFFCHAIPLDILFFSKRQRLINHMILSCLKALCSFVNTKQDHNGLCICGTHTGVSSIASSRPSSCVYLKIIILLSGIIFCLYLKVVNGIHSCRIQLNWIRDTKWYKWKPTITNTSHQFLIRRHI